MDFNIFNEVAVFVAAYLPAEEKTIEKTIDYLLNKVKGISKNNLYLIWNTRELESVSFLKYSKLLHSLYRKCNIIQAKGSKSKSENLNTGINSLPLKFKYLVIYDADARPGENSVIKLYNEIRLNPKHAYIQGNFNFTRGNNILVRYYDEMENIISNQTLTSNKKHYFKGHDAIFRIKSLIAVDGFNPNALTEDSDISKRLIAKGYYGGYLKDHISFSESPVDFKSLFKQRLRWCSGSYEIMPGGIILRFIVAISWIFAYFLFPVKTFFVSLILGLIIMKLNIKLTIAFLFYPIMITLMTLNFFINGKPTSFEVTKRDINIAGKIIMTKKRLTRNIK